MTPRGSWVLFTLSIVLAFVLTATVLPYEEPEWLVYLRPDWVLLIWFFWICFDSSKCSLGLAFLLGILIDALLFDPLGLNALLLVLVTFLARFTLRVIQPSIALRSSLTLLILCFLATTIKSIVFLFTLEVSMELGHMILTPIATVVWWILLSPLLYAENSQLSSTNQ